ncbi:MAG: hypothetical protein IJW70_07665 [Clostridia bacterium]|nr:hypothetical protein [Clostridia bacterium]
MFKKCLKYDLKAFSKIWLIAAAVVLVVSILGGIGFGSMFTASATMDEMESQNIQLSDWESALLTVRMMLGVISYMIMIYSLVIFTAGTSIMLYVHYYRKFFTDQGYLTFTLPVSRSTHFWSKTVSGLIYTAASGLVCVLSIIIVLLCVLIAALIAPDSMQQLDLSVLTQFLQSPHFVYFLAAALLGVILLIAVAFASLVLQYLIITLAATMFRKLKVLSVIVAYYVINNIVAIPVIYVGMFYAIIAIVALAYGMAGLMTIPILGWLGIYALLLLAILAVVTVGVIIANFTVQRLERKLNLA